MSSIERPAPAGRPWARRDDETVGREHHRFLGRDRVALSYEHLGSELFQQVHEVVGERVVVVDHEDAHGSESASQGLTPWV